MNNKKEQKLVSKILNNIEFLNNPKLMRALLRVIIIASIFISMIIVINLAGWEYSFELTIVLAIACFCFITYYVFKSYKEIYQEISILSDYTREIINNNLDYDIRDNEEGYVSILKNDILKLSGMLIENKENEKKEKEYLAQSLAEISHQLKTPLNSMGMMVDLLKQDIPKEKEQEFLLNMQKQVIRLTWITSALLKIAKLDSNTVELDKKNVNVATLVQKALEPLRIIIELKQQTITVNGDNTINYKGDLNWSVEALTNILKNCIEHTPNKGKITIKFINTPLYVQIFIEDNGCGIDNEDLSNIFQRFYKGKNSSPDSVGIGLAMTKSIIEKQSGYITATSTVGKGTKFEIRFYVTY
ncbi:HAMP domain-containing histidine kinase [Clostridium sp. 'deep sea']|uniref:sensor histidine kinase n=1 Tax=Clostridium sp. 'deep sea' TaxID=2779445 RepID=UPI00189682F4|nr:HAMP domain-containing sensor histidine kinase [Clostridium sp. 'deep sea']QOR35441.1 HAMP domain-containing histidine kinase [Clostridium sp. 'deep sea']